jgi:hypothetical protein
VGQRALGRTPARASMGVGTSIAVALALLVAGWCSPVNAAAATAPLVSATELIERARELDGSEVTYVGEAIGDRMIRGGYAWVNVLDGTIAIGLWMPAPLARQVTNLGAHRRRGDRVEVTGVFHRACAAHGGDMDIHIRTLKVVEPGGRVPDRSTSIGRMVLALVLTAGAIALRWVDRRRVPRGAGTGRP